MLEQFLQAPATLLNALRNFGYRAGCLTCSALVAYLSMQHSIWTLEGFLVWLLFKPFFNTVITRVLVYLFSSWPHYLSPRLVGVSSFTCVWPCRSCWLMSWTPGCSWICMGVVRRCCDCTSRPPLPTSPCCWYWSSNWTYTARSHIQHTINSRWSTDWLDNPRKY